MANAAHELGKLLGKRLKEQGQIKENLSPDEFDSQFTFYNQEQVVVEASSDYEQKCYDTNTFVLDHPVYGELDSPTLELDGGYGSCAPETPSVPGRIGIGSTF